ncbi:N-acetyltransferase family protein [Ferrovibrio sp.]|uniref:GNAT family N-acetyltransferase n=1 Tax=Ferrovibrio sp. TaxID=1917215 RepID=UPI0035AFBA6B
MAIATRVTARHLTIRPGRPEDAPALGRLHVRVWREAYRGIMADAYLAGLSEAKREAFWHQILSEPHPDRLQVVLASEQPGGIAGFLLAGPPRDLPPGAGATFRGEIYALNIAPEWQGHGHGRRLMVHAANWLAEKRMAPFCLWVLADNTKARDFYELLGGVAIAQRSETIGGARLTNMAYQFNDPASIARLALKGGQMRGRR